MEGESPTLIIIVTESSHSDTCLSYDAPTSQNGQILSNNLSGTAKEFFECVSRFCGIGA